MEEDGGDHGGDRSYRNLAPLQLSSAEMALPLDPELVHGRLPCGLSYYVKKNAKPIGRAALRLAVRVGSVDEEDHERGVAHMARNCRIRSA